MVDFVKMQALALKLVKKNGKQIVVNKLGSTPEDADKEWRGPADVAAPYDAQVTVWSVELAPASLSQTGQFGKALSKKDFPPDTETFFMIALDGSEPALDDFDEVVCEGITYRVTELVRLRPADVTVLYIAGVCK